ncbi:hypothetical protein PseBG33_2056 [Pseudomonas synxantha BG33R]|uniref:hypothetical protein n=1 Tax=Pseudomonas synxantha TaxID=47883 RepID=UPI00025FDE6D|nr:hypothetical protein [Pseudomonas synxantha]EIK69494.1 hypothetical protein PseBG33_2056 [Pseudomonas synxantha BG33R]
MNISSTAVIKPLGNAHFDSALEASNSQTLSSSKSNAVTRTKREVPGDGAFSQTSQREQANSDLAASYADVLMERTRDEDAVIANIPHASSFGQWRTQLRNALKDKGFLDWLKSDGLDPSSLKITEDGFLSVRNKQGVLTLFTLQDNSPWATFAGPILAAVKAYAPDGITWSALYEESAPLKWVAQFYGETIHNESFKDRQRAQALQENKAFSTAGAGKERSEEALVEQKRQLANKRDLQTFRDALLVAHVEADDYLNKQEALQAFNSLPHDAAAYDRSAELKIFLQTRHITLDPDSGFHLDNQPMAGKQVNLLQFMTGTGLDHPLDQAQVKNMIMELLRPTEYRQLHGDLGGGLSWPTALDSQQQQAIYDAVSYNSMKLPEFDKLKLSQSAFGYLTQTIEWSEAELKDPRQAILRLLKGPTAQAIGEALRSKFEGAGSTEDWALAALQIGLNQDALWKPEEKNKVAGFDLSARENWGKPLSFVLEGLTEHLRKSYGNNAAVAAYLLLSHHAPELLVKNIPDSVTYGSAAWVSLKAIVAKSEMRNPGAAATKTYEPLLKDDLAPITDAEKKVEALAGKEGLIHWAVADEAVEKRADNNYTEEEVERATTLASERFDTLMQASEAQRTELATRKALALNALKEKCPVKEYGVIDFEKQAIYPKVRDRGLQGPYSILDIFLQPQQHVEWYSNDPAVPIEKIFHELKFMPSPNELFEKHVVDYYDGLKGAMKVTVQHQMSLLPAEDKEALQYGELKIYGAGMITRTIADTGTGIQRRIKKVEDVKSSSVFFETLHKGSKRIYEFNPSAGGLRHRADLTDGLKVGLQGDWADIATGEEGVRAISNTTLREMKADNSTDTKEREPKPQTSTPTHTFTSARTQHIADAVTSHFFSTKEREQLASGARGVTTFDTEVTEFEKIQAVTRALIPGAAALHSFQQGRVGEGLAFLAFDIFGFVVAGAGALGKVSKIVKVGEKLGKGGVGGRLGRAFISAANPFAGGAAIGTRGLTAFSSFAGKGSLIWKVYAATASVDRVYQNKPKDVIAGIYQGVDTSKILAQLDEITGKWYRVDPKTNKRYGTPLQGFTPENSPS